MSEQFHAPGCDVFCKLRHGRGYGQADMLKLFNMYVAKRQELNGPLKKAEILALFDELDKWRGAPPAWRVKSI